ncbi:molybdopterin-synthase adenylyltransferase MoeB [Corynebacterium epidermidicanis]|uniref:Putative molybdopterin synthase sulfurylase MoeB n=1 Tax=Corynebacterium epidermidicanis TaxID=1050174 RepID=A0A0G3GUV9_9CORY|nr:molybdopterin-synthase adenylyltransferase MoeB [Corynebacterium epidermidicanis]AKK04305.1 putative molybdopterin synthase sulfurylase MoeB [Corynebacterium epidermidicanis]
MDSQQLGRYARHLTLPGIGVDGQEKLLQAKVLVIGAGGLGSPVLNYLAAAGVGHITVLDDDIVELSNLQRQTIHSEASIGELKVESARRALGQLNSSISVRAVGERLTTDNALELFREHDLVIDGADNFATRYLSNDAAELTGTPLVWGTIMQFSGQVSVFDPARGPMLRDLFPDLPDADSVPSCAIGGVLGALAGQVGSIMVIEAIKLLTGAGQPLIGRLLLIDALQATTRTLEFTRDPDRAPVTSLAALENVCAVVPVVDEPIGMLVDVRTPEEFAAGSIPGAINVPLDTLDSWEAPEGPVTFSCKSGVRSAEAVRRVGGAERYSLRGGYDKWVAELTQR